MDDKPDQVEWMRETGTVLVVQGGRKIALEKKAKSLLEAFALARAYRDEINAAERRKSTT